MGPLARHQYLLVMRHGRETTADELTEVAGKLPEVLMELPTALPLTVAAIWRADTPQAEWTAAIVAQGLSGLPAGVAAPGSPDPVVVPGLGPPHGPYTDDPTAAPGDPTTCLRSQINAFFANEDEPGVALMLVGHEPALGWLLDGWGDWKMTPPLASSELACLARLSGGGQAPTHRWHLWWVLTPSAQSAIAELREKVSSKMTAVSLLAGFAVAVAVDTLLRADEIKGGTKANVFTAAAALFGTAAIVLFGGLLAYDRLLMPPRFWSTTRPGRRPRWRLPRDARDNPLGSKVVWRPPSSAGWVLYQESHRIWRRSVHLGIALLAFGGLALMAAVAIPFGREDAASAFAVLVVAGAAVKVARHRPLVGVTD